LSNSVGDEPKPPFRPAFFAFQTSFANAQSSTPAYLAKMVQQAGFDGVELMGLDQVDAFMPELQARGLTLHSLYVKCDLDADPPYSRLLEPTLQKWKGELPYIWLHIHSTRFQASDPAGDQRCVEILRELSNVAKRHGVQIGIYHHTGFWAEKFSDGVRIARQVDRDNVGAVFNLCHYLRVSGPDRLEQELAAAFPHVMLVSINGADDGETTKMNWNRLIQPLGEGTFDSTRVLRVLQAHGYRGPIGLQGFGISARPEQFLPASVKAFHRTLDELETP